MSDKKNEILNIPEIQAEARKIHQKFIKDFGTLVEKVIADHRLLADKIIARIFRVGICFKEENIVDNVEVVDNGPYKKAVFSKIGYNTYVNVLTNGNSIVLEGYSYSHGMSDYAIPKKKYNDINDSFNWVQFSKELLDYIHATIYERQEVCQTKMKEMFTDPPIRENLEGGNIKVIACKK